MFDHIRMMVQRNGNCIKHCKKDYKADTQYDLINSMCSQLSHTFKYHIARQNSNIFNEVSKYIEDESYMV